MASFIGIINMHFASEDGSPCRLSRSVITTDSHTRPICVTVTPLLESMAHDFQQWAREKRGTTKRNEIGPSGFERKEVYAKPQELSSMHNQIPYHIKR